MKKITLTLAAAIASSSVFAATYPTTPANGPGFYLGANAGYSYIDLGVQNNAFSDNAGVGYNVHSGYMFNQYIGAELGYNKYGNANVNPTFFGIPLSSGAYNYSLYAITLAAKGVYHFKPQWSINGQVGFANMHSNGSGNPYVFGDSTGYVLGSHTKNAPFFAVAAGYDITPNVTLNAGWSYAIGGDNWNLNNTGLGNASLFYGGVDYHF